MSPLVIPLPRLQSKLPPVYVGDRVRESTATSVVLLDGQTLACCHFNGCRIFLVRFDLTLGSYEIVASADTTFAGVPTETDLMAGNGNGGLVASNFFPKACSLYQVDGHEVRLVKDIPYSTADFVHGVKFYRADVVALTSRYTSGGVHFLDTRTGRCVYRLGVPKLSVQDVCFLSDTRMIIVSTRGSPALVSKQIYGSVFHVVDFDVVRGKASKVGQFEFGAAHFDNIVMYRNVLYVTDQYNNRVVELDPENLKPLGHHSGYAFPHGLDVNFDILAVTNYGTNTVELRPLPGHKV